MRLQIVIDIATTEEALEIVEKIYYTHNGQGALTGAPDTRAAVQEMKAAIVRK